MKKRIAFIALIFTLILCSCSCSFGGDRMIDNDRKTANKKFEEILETIQSQNDEELILLFAKETIGNIKDYDKSTKKLYKYFTGEVESYDDWGGPLVETSKESDEILQIMELTYDVKTTEDEYRFAIQFVSKDTTNPNNVGVHSVYVIKMEDDINPKHAYWGDGKYTPGINIGIPNIE